MSLAPFLNSYASLNLLILVSLFFLLLVKCFCRFFRIPLDAKSELQFHYFVFAMMILLTLLQPFFPWHEGFSPTAKIWSASSLRIFSRESDDPGSLLIHHGFIGLEGSRHQGMAADSFSLASLLLMSGLIAIGGWRLFRDLYRLYLIKKGSFQIRKIGRSAIFVNEQVSVPFSYWQVGQANVVLPTGLLARPEDFRMAINHELQHHRQGDTQWVYAIWLVKVLCWFNPLIHLWSRWISEIQEFAVDATLVDRKKVKSQSYARCLVEVAQTAIARKEMPVCATGLTFLAESNLLKRRIEKMLQDNNKSISRMMKIGLASALFAGLTATALSSKNWVQDRRVTAAQMQEMARKAQDDSGFPIVVNDLVLNELNRYLGTPEGRDYMNKSLQRMTDYQAMIEGKITQYQVPMELLAIPIIESGYQNLSQDQTHHEWGAGLWMFIESTAKIFGMEVDAHVDQRLNTEIETDAAMRYLKMNELRFKDWLLSTMAYNIGESAVEKAIETSGSRDVWTLYRQGYGTNDHYVPRLMAVILIMKNPETLKN